MKKLIRLMAAGALATAFALPALAQTTPAQPAQGTGQCTEENKSAWYSTFIANYKANAPVAQDAAQKYMQACPDDTSDQAQYMRKWLTLYEKATRKQKLPQLMGEKKYAEAYALGKQMLSDDPDDLRTLILLGYGGFHATKDKNEAFNAEAIGYARKAIQLIESGKAPDSWTPFKTKDEALAYLTYTVGILNFKNAPNDALPSLIRAAQYDTELKTLPGTYFQIATAYEAGPYARMTADYKRDFEGKEESDASRLALANLNQMIDRIIDAYARAINAAGNKPEHAANKADWMKRLTALYKFRHENSEAGLNEFIAGIMSRPLPAQPTPITTLPTQPATTPNSTGTGNGATGAPAGATTPPSGTTPAQPNKSGTTPAQPAQPANKTTPRSANKSTAGKTSGNHARHRN